MNLKERLEAAKNELQEIKAAVVAGEKSAEELNAAIAVVNELNEKMKAAEAAEELIKGLSKQKTEEADQEAAPAKAESFAAQIAKQVVDRKINPREKFSITPKVKDAAPMVTPSSYVPAVTTYDPNLVLQNRRELQIRDLFAGEVINGAALEFFVESSSVEGSAGYTTEGSQKPMVSFGDPTAVTKSLDTIAAFIKESEQLLDDAPRLASAIENRLIYLQQLAVENHLVSELSGTSGIGTASLLTPDGIFNAIMTVKNNSGFAADAIVINPTDYANIRLRKDSNGQYYGGGFIYQPYGNGNVMEMPPIWGLRTVVTPAVSVGTCFVGAFRLGASVVHKASGLSVALTNTDQDDFIRNRITIRAEERIALAVRYPAAFVKISGQSTSTAA